MSIALSALGPVVVRHGLGEELPAENVRDSGWDTGYLMGAGEFDPPDPRVTFEAEVAEVRSAVKAVLDAETARGGGLRYTDDGIHADGESWNATVWRPPDDSNLVLLKCKRGSRAGWHVVIEPTSEKHPGFVIHWPNPTFEVMLKVGIRTLNVE